MKIGKQIALIAIVSLLAIGAAVAIVWFGSPTAQQTADPPGAQQPADQSTGQTQPPANEPTKQKDNDPNTGENDPADEPPDEEPGEELLFQSLGNGTCSVMGPGGVKDACVTIPKTSPAGEKVVKIASRAFFGCEGITAVQIPETVREIGDKAFADCKNLVYISVNPQNPVYCDMDGVLYTADKRILLQYPPMRAGDPLILPASVTSVSEMAFYQSKNLKSVFYEGSGEDWEHIEIGSYNYALIASVIRFNAQSE